jgi:hypothetical protein
MSEIVQPSDKIKLIFILLTTNLYDISHTDLYGTIYIDNIQKAVVICLIIPTTFPFDAGSMCGQRPSYIRVFFMLDPN